MGTLHDETEQQSFFVTQSGVHPTATVSARSERAEQFRIP